MKRFSLGTLIAVATSFTGLIAGGLYLFSSQKPFQTTEVQAQNKSKKVASSETSNSSQSVAMDEEKLINPLVQIWRNTHKFNYNGYTITKNCKNKPHENYGDENCNLKLFKGKKLVAKFKSERKNRLEFGFFKFLGNQDQQLIVHTYSGGAHCCHDYLIYDLKPTFRTVYDSTKFNQIGNEMVPIDLDKDGVFELEQSVMTFESFHVAYSSSVFPPAIFAYNKSKGRYDFSNKKFVSYILEKKNKYLKWLETTYGKDDLNCKQGTLHLTFAYLIYAGKEKEAWKYFDENYDLNDKESYRTEIKKLFAKDANYISMYGKSLNRNE
jgi:hypothetical protein